MRIKNVHREIAKLLWEGDLTVTEIALQKGVSDRAIYRWKNDPDFDALFKGIEDNFKTSAKREAMRWARRSVKTLVKLQDIAINKDERTGAVVSEEFKFGSDVARKAACDLLEMAEVKVDRIEGKGFEHNEIFNLLGAITNGDVVDRADALKRRANGTSENRLAPLGDRTSQN